MLFNRFSRKEVDELLDILGASLEQAVQIGGSKIDALEAEENVATADAEKHEERAKQYRREAQEAKEKASKIRRLVEKAKE